MNCSASATLWTRSSCAIEVMPWLGPFEEPGSLASRDRASAASIRARRRCTVALALPAPLGRLPAGGRMVRSGARTTRGGVAMSTIDSVMQEGRVFPPSSALAAAANVTKADAEAMHAKAARDDAGFWGD